MIPLEVGISTMWLCWINRLRKYFTINWVINIILPKFLKKGSELETNLDQWLYLLKHISQMNQIPIFWINGYLAVCLFSIGEIAKLKKEDFMAYEASLKHKRDVQSVNNSARRAGVMEGKASTVKNMIEQLSISDEQIARIAEVSIDFVKMYGHLSIRRNKLFFSRRQSQIKLTARMN